MLNVVVAGPACPAASPARAATATVTSTSASRRCSALDNVTDRGIVALAAVWHAR